MATTQPHVCATSTSPTPSAVDATDDAEHAAPSPSSPDDPVDAPDDEAFDVVAAVRDLTARVTRLESDNDALRARNQELTRQVAALNRRHDVTTEELEAIEYTVTQRLERRNTEVARGAALTARQYRALHDAVWRCQLSVSPGSATPAPYFGALMQFYQAHKGPIGAAVLTATVLQDGAVVLATVESRMQVWRPALGTVEVVARQRLDGAVRGIGQRSDQKVVSCTVGDVQSQLVMWENSTWDAAHELTYHNVVFTCFAVLTTGIVVCGARPADDDDVEWGLAVWTPGLPDPEWIPKPTPREVTGLPNGSFAAIDHDDNLVVWHHTRLGWRRLCSRVLRNVAGLVSVPRTRSDGVVFATSEVGNEPGVATVRLWGVDGAQLTQLAEVKLNQVASLVNLSFAGDGSLVVGFIPLSGGPGRVAVWAAVANHPAASWSCFGEVSQTDLAGVQAGGVDGSFVTWDSHGIATVWRPPVAAPPMGEEWKRMGGWR